MESKLKEGSVGDEREFHELAMNYRGASVVHVAKAYESLAAFVDARVARSASVQGAAIPAILYDGYAVYEEHKRLATNLRTSPENVSDTLDAVVRLLRKSAATSTPAVQPLAAIAEQQKVSELLTEVADVLMGNNWRGDLVEQLRDLAASAGPVAAPASQHKALNGIPETLRHGEGAIARCSYCGRYSLDPAALSDRQPVCECGKQHGWCGSFVRPDANSKWSGNAPVAAPEASAIVHTGAPK